MLKATQAGAVFALTYGLFTAPPAQAAQDEDNGYLEEILVTAQRRSENIQDIPISLTALSSDDIETRAVGEILDIGNYIPNLIAHNNVGQGTANNYALRGLGNTESIATFDPPVGTYIDDIYISRQNANNFTLFDIERVEVLRGPQGTLFGRNTTGGAVRLIHKKPADRLGASLDFSYGRFKEKLVRGSIDAPLSDKVLTKFSAYYLDDDGYVFNVRTNQRLNDAQGYGLRGAVTFLLNDEVRWDLSAAKINHDEASTVATPRNGDGVSPFSSNAVFTLPLADAAQTALPRIANTGLRDGKREKDILAQFLNGNGPNFNEVDSWLLSSNAQFDIKDMTIEVITGYLDLEQDFVLDFFDGAIFSSPPVESFGTFSIANEGSHEQFTQELRAHGSLVNDAIDYVAGVYYYNEHNDARFAQINGFRLFNPANAGSLLDYDRLLENNTQAIAGYIQADWHFSNQLSLTTGLRFTDERKKLSISHFTDVNPALVGPTTSVFSTADVITANIPTRLKTNIWTPRFALEYKPGQDLLFFLSATKGFKSGGWNARGVNADQLQAFGAEKTWSYEAGVKSEWLNQRVRINLTGFYADTEDFQLPAAFTDDTGSIIFITRNFADLEVYGLEAEAQAALTPYLNIYSTLGLQNADYRNPDPAILAQQLNCQNNALQCGEGIITPSGDISKPVRTPDITWTTGFEAHIPTGLGRSEIALHSSITHVSNHLIAVANTPEGFAPSRWVMNSSIGFQSDEKLWGLYLECANCFGETYPTSALAGFVYYNEPSTWRIRTRFRF